VKIERRMNVKMYSKISVLVPSEEKLFLGNEYSVFYGGFNGKQLYADFDLLLV
jgi:hypothetical protein